MKNALPVLSKSLNAVGKRIAEWHLNDDELSVSAVSEVSVANCPACAHPSTRIHGRYNRKVAERPCVTQPVTLSVEVRRFKCINTKCPRQTFVEDLGSLAEPYQRRTRVLAQALRAFGYALGGAAASRLTTQLGMPASADTVLRQLRRAGVPRAEQPVVRGIDDWAIKRGHHYGTLIVDLERRQPIGLLPGREANVVAQWLSGHPSVSVVCRDRAGAYSEAVKTSLPEAQQVADRWHLLDNLRESIERLLYRLGPKLRESAKRVRLVNTPCEFSRPALRASQRLSEARRAARLARYEEVVRLRQQGHSLKAITHIMSLHYATVRKFVTAGVFPERAPRGHGATLLDPHRAYLEERFAQGCRKPVTLWQELRARGFTGSRATVRDALARLNASAQRAPGAEQVRTMPCPSVRKTFGWLVGWRKLGGCEPKQDEHRQFVDILCRNEPMIARARRLAREFLGIIHRRDLPRFDRWLGRLRDSGVPELKRYAASLETDLSAVRAAFALPWSNGQVEGQVNRLKFLKRQMYGRASVELLRLRVLRPI